MSSAPQVLTGEIKLHVYYEDTDFTGFVYHANYLKFCERAREHLFGINNLKNAFASNHHFVVRSMQIRFHLPAHHGDELMVRSECTPTSAPRWTVEQKIFRQSAQGALELIFSASVEIVHLGPNGAPSRVDPTMLARFTNPD
jgi:acyl-CoA thioester hydrolase